MDDDLTAQDAMDAMDAVYLTLGTPEIEPGEFTQTQYAERYGLSLATAGRHLEAALQDGRLTRRYATSGGKRCWAYRPAQR